MQRVLVELAATGQVTHEARLQLAAADGGIQGFLNCVLPRDIPIAAEESA